MSDWTDVKNWATDKAAGPYDYGIGQRVMALIAENERLENERAELWRGKRDVEAARDTKSAVIAELKAENEALRKADEWIKCSEKLPDLDEEVLAVDQYGDIDVGHYFSGYMGKLCFSSNKEISMPTHWKKNIGLPERTGT